MADDSEDPALLFTPVPGPSNSTDIVGKDETPLTPLTLDASTRLDAKRNTEGTRFYVDVPRLSEEERAKYMPLENFSYDSDSGAEDSSKLEEIEGEYRLGNRLFLYARYGDGILRRKEDWEFRTSYPELYANYVKRKKEGRVADFDPSSLRIHPKHRVQLVINLQRRKATVPEDKDYVSESEPSDEDTEDDDSDVYEGTYVRHSTRASRRQAGKQIRALPYSPRTTRTRRGSRIRPISIDGSDSESEQRVPRRRSSRNTGKISYAGNDDSDYRSEEVESHDAEKPIARSEQRRTKRKGPKAAYGRIRKVEDLYDSDPDTAALRGHRDECEKCHRAPAHILLKKLGKRTTRKKKAEDDLTENEEDYFKLLGGWVRCLKCCVAVHWHCLARAQRAEIVKAARAKAKAEPAESNGSSNEIKGLDVTETTEFICGNCSKGGICMMCKQVAIESENKPSEPGSTSTSDTGRVIDELSSKDLGTEGRSLLLGLKPDRELLFRCYLCKRLAHYSHLPVEDEDLTPAEVAKFYQNNNSWQCDDCASYIFQLDKIIAWRPSSSDAVDPYVASPGNASYKEDLPREYLVKWVGRSFRRVEWVPHMWLVASHWAKLKNFYELGPRLDILSRATDERSISVNNCTDHSRSASADVESRTTERVGGPPPPMLDDLSRIPLPWTTVDRVLDVLIWAPRKGRGGPEKTKTTKRRKGEGDDSEAEISQEAHAEYDGALDLGEEPSTEVTETVDEFEGRTGEELGEEHIGRIIWAFIKWNDLPYDESTWDSPPRPGSFGYADFQRAFRCFLLSRKVVVKKKTASEVARFDERGNWNKTRLGIGSTGEYDIGQEGHLKLMPFQVHGVNWLCRNWFYHQQCILADEMGLGKTVQIITFLGLLLARMGAFPCLVVVPNSTITNWVREFARWAPGLRVVPFCGEQKSREIIKKYELQHPIVAAGTTGAKYHVLVVTYEAVTNPRDFNSVFKKTPRWEVLIVDEGQRLKSDSSLIFRRLNELNSSHRIIMTGTPLNNNIRELFNLMNFLDQDKWNDLESLTREFEELDEQRVKELHERLRPYFLRRVKADVLHLPPKNEVIVPVSMSPLQKEIYKSILSKNSAVLRSLRDVSSAKLNKSAAKASNLKNMLMQLRKCLQHPYLVADDIEPKGLSTFEAHLKLIDASGKLRLLKILLPKLKAQGHRVLLFSQFVIGLNIIEDFLQGEGYKFLRLDGNTKQAERQKNVDEFNKENSDVFIYILSTRAGGVGINLWGADTVIIFDPDFNPHQDLQAISRAHRYGQKKTVLVFKFMTKNSAEEKIIQTGKKKLVLDHLIVQKMDDEEDYSEVQSILTFGAKALFDEETEANRDIIYSENEVDTLIEKIETEGDNETSEASNTALSFARVWSAQKDDLEELPDEAEEDIQGDSWAQTLQKIAEEQEHSESQERAGRGVRRKAAMLKKKYFEDGSPDKPIPQSKKRRKSGISGSSDDEYNLPQTREPSEAASTETSITEIDLDHKKRKLDGDNSFSSSLKVPKPQPTTGLIHAHPLSPILNQGKVEYCGLCSTEHGPGRCHMTDNPLNLVEYRKLLIHSEEESYAERIRAIQAIDETLSQRGVLHLISGQPMKPMKKHSDRSNTLMADSRDTEELSLKQLSHAFPSYAGRDTYQAIKWREVRTADKTGAISVHAGNAFAMPPIVPLKRGSLSMAENVAQQKPKVRTCEICMKVPYHLPVHCPVVMEGPRSILKAITRLTSERGNPATLTALRSILRKQRKALEESAQGASAKQAVPSSNNQ